MNFDIINKSERDEKHYLEKIKEKLQTAINATDKNVENHVREVLENKDYLWENRAELDKFEKISVCQSITQIALSGENALAKKKRLAKLMKSPYFGRIDFIEKNENEPFAIYIGIHSFHDQQNNINLIHDWRAPISSMFYDFELGSAFFEAPIGLIKGEIINKRQFRIREGKFEFMLESSLNIHDDILQKELSLNSNDKMKNIVATIQRDQNAIIRNENSRVLVIQGVAGSGKTSIALHRIAFLLYRFKDTIKSDDILIISPNKVFADYISNVLPELGEEKIRETSMEELADELLDGKYKFQSFFEQVSVLLEKEDEKYKERIRFKSGFEILSKLSDFLVYIENEYFTPETITIRRNPIPASYIAEKYNNYRRLPALKRTQEIVREIIDDLSFYNNYKADAADRNQIKKDIEKMFRTTNIRKIYADFYQWLGKPELLKTAKGSRYEYADVFPIIYLKMSLEGFRTYEKVKHLVVDEMQDYTPLQYSIIARLFPCNKTILGDCNQSVNPYSSTDMSTISQVFPMSDCMTMRKSYRSTLEITNFAQKIRYNADLETIERHGEAPEIVHFKNNEDEIIFLRLQIGVFLKSNYKSLGIICKTQSQADELYEQIKDCARNIYVLNSQSAAFSDGIIISTAHMAKGLEFDCVIVPFCNSSNYNTETDRQMLYVACTRAMHILKISYTKNISDILK